MTTQRIRLALKDCSPSAIGGIHGNRQIPDASKVEMLACMLQRVHDLLSGKPYYDYDLQKWVDAEGRDATTLNNKLLRQ